MADPDTDEVYVKMRLIPLREHELDLEDDCFLGNNGLEGQEKPTSFAKTLTQSDANNGGGFSVPRYCAETIFPRLDYSAEPPVQTIIAKDMHGQCWKFRHIYRGTPRRHLLTTGWSNFVNQKKLVAGDSIVFLRAENGESVVEAVTCAVNGRPFEVVYYPRASTPEFCVKASAVKASMQIQWCSGMRFKMPFETEDSSRISWFMGTISSVQVADPIRWPDSPWRLLQVVWDEPDLLQNVKCVNPWLVELVSNMPTFNLSPFSPPRKKQRFIQDPYFHLINQLPMPPLSSNFLSYTNSLCNIKENSSAGIQGARHAQIGLTPSDFPFNKLQPDMLLGGFSRLDHATQPVRPPCGTTSYNKSSTKTNVDISCLLTVGNPGQNFKESNEAKTPHILLFGKLIHTEQKSSNSCSASTTGNNSVSEGTSLKTSNDSSHDLGFALHQNSPIENSSDGGSPWYKDQHKSDLGAENVSTLCMAL
ncbi:DNA-binding barrel domain superfamily [Sesbania bispinosa]|nr:DNA-binding barrel domain superfamily [Sesbania bispinosa]